MLEEERLTWPLLRLLTRHIGARFAPAGRSFRMLKSYSPSPALKNHARPGTIGPETVNRGVQLLKFKPLRSKTVGKKLVALNLKLSSPVPVVRFNSPPEALPYCAE